MKKWEKTIFVKNKAREMMQIGFRFGEKDEKLSERKMKR